MTFEISVFLENKISHFERISGILKNEKVNIRSITMNNLSHGWGILNLLVDQPQKAYRILSDKGNSVVLREIIALEMKDEAGGLDELLMEISRAGIHLDNAYSRLISEEKRAILIIEVPDVLEAKQRLIANRIKILDNKTVYGS